MAEDIRVGYFEVGAVGYDRFRELVHDVEDSPDRPESFYVGPNDAFFDAGQTLLDMNEGTYKKALELYKTLQRGEEMVVVGIVSPERKSRKQLASLPSEFVVYKLPRASIAKVLGTHTPRPAITLSPMDME